MSFETFLACVCANHKALKQFKESEKLAYQKEEIYA